VEGTTQTLGEIVGDGNISGDPAPLESFSRDPSFVLAIKPKLVVQPDSEDQVLALVAWANRTATPLVPVSSGAPHFYGDTVPSVPGAVMVDLSRMNRILKVDRRNRMAVIEPGVTCVLGFVLLTEGEPDRVGEAPVALALHRKQVADHVPSQAGAQAHQLRLGRRLHRQLDPEGYARPGQGVRADRQRRSRPRRKGRLARAIRG
jgi:hypothetical protein